jgi:hypothetical protein
MGLFDHDHAKNMHGQVYGGQVPHADVTHEMLAAAAGFEAMRMYEHHRERQGMPVHHELAKELIGGFAAAEVDKHFDQGRFGHLDRGQARTQAQRHALGMFEQFL